MQIGIQSYVDPTEVLSQIINEFGENFEIGEEQDIGVFNELFIGRISDSFEA